VKQKFNEETSPINQMIFTPTICLQRDVNCFWILEGAQRVYRQHDIIPDPYAELVITCGAPLYLETKNGASIQLPPVYLGRLQTQAWRLRASAEAQVMAVRFYPWAATSFWDRETTLSHMNIMALNGSWQRFAATELHKRLRQGEYAESIAELQQFVLDRWRGIPARATAIQTAGRLLNETGGQMNVEILARQCLLSTRELERRFKYFTGVSPKMYARLIRFEAFCLALVKNPVQSLAGLAQQAGYSDQSHLTHELQILAGCTPGTLAARVATYIKQSQNGGLLQDA
jgi:AraC-like DNA-binding protein